MPVAGEIKLMPGTASNPSYRGIDVDVNTGKVRGTFLKKRSEANYRRIKHTDRSGFAPPGRIKNTHRDTIPIRSWRDKYKVIFHLPLVMSRHNNRIDL